MDKNISIDERIEIAMQCRRNGYNCAQSTVAAFSDVLQLPQDVTVKISCGFGAGFGGLQRVCGVMSAITMLEGTQADDAVAHKASVYKAVKQLGEKFENACGSLECRELKAPGAVMPCDEIIKTGIRIYHDYLNSK